MTFPLPLTLEIASTRTLYLDLTLGLGFNIFFKSLRAYLWWIIIHMIRYLWVNFFSFVHSLLHCVETFHMSKLCMQKLFIDFHFISCLSFQSSPMFAFPLCSGLEQATISSISILHQSSIYVEELCLCQKKFHIESLLCQSFLNIFALIFPFWLRVCPFLFCSWNSRRSFLVYFKKHLK